MHKLIRTTAAALTALAILLLVSITAQAYEFHMLGGMVIKGDLNGFSDGVFLVDTEFGELTINSANLDYIIVEETDSAGERGAPESGLEFGMPDDSAVRTDSKTCGIEKVELPAALAGYSVPADRPDTPEPLCSWSVAKAQPGTFTSAPAPLGGHTLGGVSAAPSLPGVFRPAAVGGTADIGGGRVITPPAPVGASSAADVQDVEDELPETFDVTVDELAGAYLELGGGGRMPDPLESYSLDEAAEDGSSSERAVDNTATITYIPKPQPRPEKEDAQAPFPGRFRGGAAEAPAEQPRPVVVTDTQRVTYELVPPAKENEEPEPKPEPEAAPAPEAEPETPAEAEEPEASEEPAQQQDRESKAVKNRPSKPAANSFEKQMGSSFQMGEQDEYWWHKLEGDTGDKQDSEEADDEAETGEPSE